VQELDAGLDADNCNLLLIHSKVSELENCRDELLYYGMTMPAGPRRELCARYHE
jgi:hypothetical protein